MPRNNRQVAFLFNEAAGLSADKIGGKAKGLITMIELGMPVPPGFAITTGVCRAYLEHARYPKRLEFHIKRCMSELERQTGKCFGDPSNPLFVSVRSGAPVSMPGMMDTILNLGMNMGSLDALEKIGGRDFARNTEKRFYHSFKKVVGSEPPRNPWEQLELAFEAVSVSWLNDRAVEYRKAHGIPEDMGTAMIVQAMVFGNIDEKSGTGVFFSRNVATGDNVPYGEFLPKAQGEDLVGGVATPHPIEWFAKGYPDSYKGLQDAARILEERENDVVEFEFTLESGKLWTLQYRVAKRTSVAAARFAVQFVWEKRLQKPEAVKRLSDDEARQLREPEFDEKAVAEAITANRTIAKGRVIRNLTMLNRLAVYLCHPKQMESSIPYSSDHGPEIFKFGVKRLG